MSDMSRKPTSDMCRVRGMGVARERERVDVFAHLFEALFVSDAEALLFVDDQQAEILKLYVFGEQAMRADDYVHFSGFQIREDFFLLGGGAESAEHFDLRRKSGEALLEGFVMLERQHRGGSQHRDLFAVANDFEGGAHRHFGLAVSHVAAEQAIHRCRLLHILLDVRDRQVLVVRLFEFERVFKFALPISVGGKCESLRGFPRGVKSNNFSAMSSSDLRTFAFRVFQPVRRACPAEVARLPPRGSSAPDPCARAEHRAALLPRTCSSMNSPRRPSDSIWRKPSNWPMP